MSLTRQQIAIRKTGLTASDMRALSGVDPYGRGPWDVFADKFDLAPANDTTQAKRLGWLVEPVIRKEIERAVNLAPRKVPASEMTVRHRKYGHHIATPDGFLERAEGRPSGRELHALEEAKLVGFHARGAWGEAGSEDFPEGFLVQCTWQMHVTGARLVHLGAMLGTEVRIYRVEFNEGLEAELVEIAERFHRDHIQTRKPPPVDGSQGAKHALKKLYARSGGPVKVADARAEKVAAQYLEAEKAIEGWSPRLEKARQALIVLAGSCDGIDGKGWTMRHKARKAYDVPPKRGYHVAAGRTFRLSSHEAKQ